MIAGVDVSSWQPEEFPLVLDGKPVDFAIVKVTEGMDYLSPKWKAQRDHARHNGLSVGYYHFVRPGDMRRQADYFLACAQPAPGEHLWLDWEDSDVPSALKDDWIRYVKEKAPQARVGLYCSRNFWLNLDLTSYAGDALWIAHHGAGAGDPGIEYGWTIHQYSPTGGIDRNVARFESRGAMKLWAASLIVEPQDPLERVLAELKGVNDRIDRIVIEEATREIQRKVRYDTLKELVDRIWIAAEDLIRDDAEAARAVVDELARRLES